MNLQTILKASSPALFEAAKEEANTLNMPLSDFLKGALARELAVTSDYGARCLLKLDRLIKQAKETSAKKLEESIVSSGGASTPHEETLEHVEQYNLWQKDFDWHKALDPNLPELL